MKLMKLCFHEEHQKALYQAGSFSLVVFELPLDIVHRFALIFSGAECSDCKFISTMSNKYNLKWNSHHLETFQAFERLRTREMFVDVTLSCEGQFLKAHKLVLSASSQYLERILQRDGSASPSIHFFGIENYILRLLVEFMYNGEVEVPSADLERFILLAEKLEVKGLKGDGRAKGSQLNFPVEDVETPIPYKRRSQPLSAQDFPYPMKQRRLGAMTAPSANSISTQVDSHSSEI